MALTIRVAVEASGASSSRLWVSLLTVSTLMSGLPRVTPRRPERKTQPRSHTLGQRQNKFGFLLMVLKKKQRRKRTKQKQHFILFNAVFARLVRYLHCVFYSLPIVIGALSNLAGRQPRKLGRGFEFC